MPFLLIIIVIFVIAFCWFGKGFFKSSSEALGHRGEMETAIYLSRLPAKDYFVYNDMLLRFGSHTTQIDHVVVSRYGVFVIETKNMHGKIYGSEDREYWSQYLPQRFHKLFGNQEFKVRNPIWQNTGHIRSLRRIIPDESIPFYGIVVFPPDAKVKVTSVSPVISWREVPRYIKSFSNDALSDETVSRVRQQLEAKMDHNEEDRNLHIQNVQQLKERRDRNVASGICPLCGGSLVIRNGRYGRFYGCSNYPRCRYTLNP